MKKFVDTHCHIYAEYYDDIPFFMNEILNNGVGAVINNAVDINSMKEVLSLTDNYNSMFAALGIHPEYANSFNENDLLFLENHINDSKVIAVGEIGLDYHYEGFNKERQIDLFKLQLKLASKYNLPVIVHSREATLDTMNILKEYSCKGVIHSFSGSFETAKEYIKMGYYLGINGVVTFKNAKLIDVIKRIGLSNIVLETDSPYLTPVPYRGQKNDPSKINNIIEFLSENLNISKEEIIDTTNKNVRHIFDKINTDLI